MSEFFSDGYNLKELIGTLKVYVFLLLAVFLSVLLITIGFLLLRTPTYTATLTASIEPLSKIQSIFEGNASSKILSIEPLTKVESISEGNNSSTIISIDPLSKLISISEATISSTNIVKEIQYLKNPGTILRALSSMDLASFKRKDGTDFSDLLDGKGTIKTLISKIGITQINNSNLVELSFKYSHKKFADAFLLALYQSFHTILTGLTADILENENHLIENQLMNSKTNLVEVELARDSIHSDPRFLDALVNADTYKKVTSFLEIQIRDVESLIIAPDITEVLESLGIGDFITTKLIEDFGQAYRTLLFHEINRLLNFNISTEIGNKDFLLASYMDNLEIKKGALLDNLNSFDGIVDVNNALSQITNSVKYSLLKIEKQYFLDKIKEFSLIENRNEQVDYELNQQRGKVIQYSDQLKSFEEIVSTISSPTTIIKPIDRFSNDTNKLIIIVAGMVLGILMGVIVVLIYDAISDSIINELFVKRMISPKISFWSSIPKVKTDKYFLDRDVGVIDTTNNGASDAFKQLAGIIQHRVYSNENQVYCFSSSGYRESSISTVLNLALQLIQNDKKVLIIGTNFEEIDYQELYAKIIVSGSFIEKVSFEKIEFDSNKRASIEEKELHLAYTNLEPIELSILMNSGRFEEYLNFKKETYDLILIDGPTFKSPSNLLSLAQVSQGLVLNVRPGIASKKDFQALLSSMSYSQIPIIGLVFNSMFGVPSVREKRRKKI